MTEPVRSLTELLERSSARRFLQAPAPGDFGLAEHLAFPFLGIVGQEEMKLALLLTLINPVSAACCSSDRAAPARRPPFAAWST